MKNVSISIVQGIDGRVGLKFSSPLTLQEALQLYFTGALALLRSYTPALPSAPFNPTQAALEEQQNAIGEIYDLFNVGASHVLDVYAPEIALRPDLTTESIFEAELKLLSEKYNVPTDAVKAYAAKTRAAIKENT